jgi:hypothetical protein
MVPTHIERPDHSTSHTRSSRDDRETLVLRSLGRLTTPVDLTELAAWVFVTSHRPTTREDGFEMGVGREKARLHYVDLPQLERAGVLEYDRRGRVITSYDVPDHLTSRD